MPTDTDAGRDLPDLDLVDVERYRGDTDCQTPRPVGFEPGDAEICENPADWQLTYEVDGGPETRQVPSCWECATLPDDMEVPPVCPERCGLMAPLENLDGWRCPDCGGIYTPGPEPERRTDGGDIKAETLDDLPEPDPTDARLAVIDAARHNGLTCARGAYKATRGIHEPDPRGRPGDFVHVVWLSLREPGSEPVAWFRVTDFADLRDDWSHPTPCEPGETVLPASEYELAAVFPDPRVLPGGDGDAE